MSKWRKHIQAEHYYQQEHDGNGQSSKEARSQSSQCDRDRLPCSCMFCGLFATFCAKSPPSDCYDLPLCMSFIRRWTIFKFVPFCPTFLDKVKHSHTANDIEANGGQGVANEAADMSSEDIVSHL